MFSTTDDDINTKFTEVDPIEVGAVGEDDLVEDHQATDEIMENNFDMEDAEDNELQFDMGTSGI